MNPPASPLSDVLAFDVGGACIKAADGEGWSVAEPFAMWTSWRGLAERLTQLALARRPRRLVATMTGEIADCFSGRAEGVRHIVAALAVAAESCGASPVEIYRLDGRLVSADEAVADPIAVSASNWHAVARLAAAVCRRERGLLIDIGSTTTDIIPLAGNRPVPLAIDDAGRMASGELVYTGVERTPVATIVRALPYRGRRQPVASERFAESRDAWLLLGDLPEDSASHDTADGGPCTAEAARVRLARMILMEPSAMTRADAVRAARRIVAAQASLIARALEQVVATQGWLPETIVVSGHGERLVRMAVARAGWTTEMVSLPSVLGADLSRSAPAHALALIARGALP